MSRYYDHDGQPIGMMQWAELFEDPTNHTLALSRFLTEFIVSTVWLGLDHNFFPGGRPLIFETMVFGPENVVSTIFPDRLYREDYDQQRYTTKEEALAGHWQLVALVSVEHGEPMDTFVGAWA